ncbi:hypothetical protein B0H63DRAFT_486813 [Podospora didyma]|uniref:Uncharacterized protein n=1 Tax=Podospora didyma TaxID=330526 RepID=A0AAE0K640_9PEZI|nr:hypothetical protein B0H63DRAFT_486813 [Podospora didyma]
MFYEVQTRTLPRKSLTMANIVSPPILDPASASAVASQLPHHVVELPFPAYGYVLIIGLGLCIFGTMIVGLWTTGFNLFDEPTEPGPPPANITSSSSSEKKDPKDWVFARPTSGSGNNKKPEVSGSGSGTKPEGSSSRQLPQGQAGGRGGNQKRTTR